MVSLSCDYDQGPTQNFFFFKHSTPDILKKLPLISKSSSYSNQNENFEFLYSYILNLDYIFYAKFWLTSTKKHFHVRNRFKNYLKKEPNLEVNMVVF